MDKSIHLRNVPEDIHKKFVKVKNLIKSAGVNIEHVLPQMFEKVLDEYLKHPDVKKYL